MSRVAASPPAVSQVFATLLVSTFEVDGRREPDRWEFRRERETELNRQISCSPDRLNLCGGFNGNLLCRMIGYHSHSACLHAVFANMNLKLVTRFDNDFYVGPIMPRRFLRDRNRLSVSIKVNLGAGYFQSVPVHHKTASFM